MPNHTETKSWELENGTIRFFDQAGRDLGTTWLIGQTDLAFSMKIHPTKVSSRLKRAADEADADRTEKEIMIAPGDAVLLFLEGIITEQDLASAVESDETITLEIDVDGQRRHIKIDPEAEAL